MPYFERAQELLTARSNEYSQNRTVPWHTLGGTLLSGNIYCAHCGGKLVATTNPRKYVLADSTVNVSRIHRYVCYNKVRHHALCSGQSGYTAKKIDDVIDQLIRKVLHKCKDMPAEPLVKMRLATKITESKALQKKAMADMEAATAEMSELQEEVFRVIRGESVLHQSVLAEMLKVSEQKVAKASKRYMDACESVRDVDRLVQRYE